MLLYLKQYIHIQKRTHCNNRLKIRTKQSNKMINPHNTYIDLEQHIHI